MSNTDQNSRALQELVYRDRYISLLYSDFFFYNPYIYNDEEVVNEAISRSEEDEPFENYCSLCRVGSIFDIATTEERSSIHTMRVEFCHFHNPEVVVFTAKLDSFIPPIATFADADEMMVSTIRGFSTNNYHDLRNVLRYLMDRPVLVRTIEPFFNGYIKEYYVLEIQPLTRSLYRWAGTIRSTINSTQIKVLEQVLTNPKSIFHMEGEYAKSIDDELRMDIEKLLKDIREQDGDYMDDGTIADVYLYPSSQRNGRVCPECQTSTPNGGVCPGCGFIVSPPASTASECLPF